MKVLIATFTFLPNADGVAEAGATMARGFAERGHEVIVATEYCARRTNFEPIPGVRVEQFRISGNPNLRVGIRGDVDAYRKFLLETDPDYLICHCWDCWPTWLAQAIFDKLRARKILVSHGCSSQVWQRQRAFPWGLGQWLGWQHLTLRLPFIMRSYDHVVFLSEQRDLGRFFDHLLADLTGFRRHSVIPNAVNLSLFLSLIHI